MSDADLQAVFQAFVSFGTREAVSGLDNVKFFKAIKEAGLIGKALTRQDVDLAFAKVKSSPSARRIDFPQFKSALAILGKKKYPKSDEGQAFEKVASALIAKGGPGVSKVTKTDTSGGFYSKMTDSSLYTGAHKSRFDEEGRGRGLEGRDRGHEGKVEDLSEITRPGFHTSGARHPSSARRDAPTASVTDKMGKVAISSGGGSGGSGGSGKAPASARREGHPQNLQQVFEAFAMFGAGGGAPQMDGAKLAKLARDCKLLDKKLTKTDVDLIFTTVKDKSARKIGFEQFKRAVELMGKKKFPGMGPDEVLKKMEDLMVAAGGPVAKGTVADTSSGFYAKMTDSSQYTGAHKQRFDAEGRGRGAAGRDVGGKGIGHGPAAQSQGKVADLSQITRSNLH